MRVFVAGASGAVGRQLVPQLINAGHEVIGMSRSERGADGIRSAGAEAVVCDVFDRERLNRVMRELAPEVVVHQLTALPEKFVPGKIDYGPTDRLRTEGTGNLIAAAREAGAWRFIAQSITFLLAPEGGPVLDEEARPFTDAPEPFGTTVQSAVDMERQVVQAEGIEGLVLRYGFFYGPGTYYARGGFLAGETRRRRQPVVGNGAGVFSFCHVEDAASATVAAVESPATGVLNVCDDEPAPMKEWLPVYAAAIGAKPPRHVPRFIARLVAGASAAGMATRMRGSSNARAKAELGWRPRYASWRQGFTEALG